MLRDRSAFHTGVNMYVPKMQYASHVNLNQANAFSLGTPIASALTNIDTGIVSNAVALTEDAISYTADSPYGRTVILSPAADPGANGVLDIYGTDYLGQLMVERYTFTSGSTAAIYGKKAFKTLFKSKIVTASANATTYRIGTGFRLGLPYKGDVNWAKENGLMVPVFNRDQYTWVDRDAAEAIAGGSHYIRAPFPGFVKTLAGLSAGAGAAVDPVITVELGNVAITGLTVTVDTNVAGNNPTDTPTTIGYNANNRFRAGDLIEFVGAAAAGAGPDTLGLELSPTQFTPWVTTDPQTVTADDPRGTYEPIITPNGVAEIIVGLKPDLSYNTAGNGGLHGIRHVVS